MSSRIFSELFDNKNYLLSETEKLLLSADIDLNPGPAEIPILLIYGRRFMLVLIEHLLFMTWKRKSALLEKCLGHKATQRRDYSTSDSRE